MEWIDFPDNRFKVFGLAWYEEDKPALRRLPMRLKDTFRQPVWDLAQNPAGGRIRFRTYSQHVGIRAESPDTWVMNHITRIGQSGFDIYVDDSFMGSVSPDEHCKIEANWTIASTSKPREITINMPLYKSVTIQAIGLDEGAIIGDPAPFRLDKPVLFYGTSITQGGCASTPGTSYQSFISRWLEIDFINLGFSGNGMGEPELASAINELDPSCIIIDYWANIGDKLEKNLPEFAGALRTKHKEIPIIVVGPFYFTSESVDPTLHDWQRKVSKAYVDKMRRKGDKNIYFFDGRKMIDKAHSFGLVDGVHANSLGFYFVAQGFTPYLKRVLGL